ncbi:hypothetical protein BO94DRAFT_456440, partial [Aspergillus sclerotioniger CBS 115572]
YIKPGPVKIAAEGWDIEALLIILRVIHEQYDDIPQELSLEMLAKVAVVLHYYGCRELMVAFTETWMKALDKDIAETYCRDLMLWVWVTWCFREPSKFRLSTAIAMSSSEGLIDGWGLPIPEKIIESMNEDRHKFIEKQVSKVYSVFEDFTSGRHRGCSSECQSRVIGTLTRYMKDMHILDPRPTAPYQGLNFKGLTNQITSCKSPEWPNPMKKNTTFARYCENSCFLSDFGSLTKYIPGLDLPTLIKQGYHS